MRVIELKQKYSDANVHVPVGNVSHIEECVLHFEDKNEDAITVVNDGKCALFLKGRREPVYIEMSAKDATRIVWPEAHEPSFL